MMKKIWAALTAVMMCAFVVGCRQQEATDSLAETTTVVDSEQETTETETTKSNEETTKASEKEADATTAQETETQSDEDNSDATVAVDDADVDDLDQHEQPETTEEITEDATAGEPVYDSDGYEEL